MSSKDYWENRKAQRMWEHMQKAEDTADEIAKLYYSSSKYLNSNINEIFDRYAAKHKLSKYEAKKLLNSLTDPTSFSEMLVKLKASTSTEEKNELIKVLEAPAYRSRINRLEQMQKEIDVMMSKIYQQEKDFNTVNYIDISHDAYYKSMYDIQVFTGYGFSFNQMNPQTVDKLLNSTWKGTNYSERIWNNTQALAKDIKEELLMSMITGKAEKEVAEDIAIKYCTAASNARRLVRTESNYIAEELEAQSYEECGAKKYRFIATLDLRTSELCRDLDNKEFLLSKRRPGENCPPMHPWCRSTTSIHIDESVLKKLKRRARDPETGKTYLVSADTKYKDWLEDQQDKHGVDDIEVFRKKVVNRNSDRKQHKQYMESSIHDYVPKSIDNFQDLKYNNYEEFKLLKDRKSLYKRAIEKGTLPNYEVASTPQDKVQRYLLNSNHKEGKSKAYVFNKRLGYNYENWGMMSDEIFKELARCPADNKRSTKYGVKYDVPMVLQGKNKKSLKIKTTWQINKGSSIPRLVTATFYKKKKG